MDKLICVGKNYLEHAQEMGDGVPEVPVLFLKPPSSLVSATRRGESLRVALPRERGSVHYECEIVLRLSAEGVITDFTLGLDMTLREVQAQLKKNSHPWEIAKVFAASAIVGTWSKIDRLSHEGEFRLEINGETRQLGTAAQMRLSPEDCVAHARRHFPLCDGDLLFTGTPAGVGQVAPGDVARLFWQNECWLEVQWI
ncbi:MAG TPA: fumarylacetoacetate hydrolase family protein [Bdellovibrionota bacterium]|jgi:2-keto-4-pentenoate hydratase/2-oxohepta-3-ene-1,7-dioic acid hydratase in catechol pathway|nr:fumarylacetoacetate hydrolase family protein [Bdellovibrionota bacterium]